MKLHPLFLGLAIALSSFAARADTFNFSYTFSSGNVVSGSFSGTANGQFIDSISNISASWNGTPFNGSSSLYTATYDQSLQAWRNDISPIVSFDGSLNNFLFIDAEYPTGQIAYTNFFGMIGVGGGGDYQAFFANADGSDNQLHYDSGSFASAHWSVTSPVPEPETYALLLAGLSLLGFAARRRKLNEAATA